jgi:hypothetical protein
MVSERICLDILKALRGRRTTLARTFNLSDDAPPNTVQSHEDDALSESALYRPLLAQYDLNDVEAAVRWLYLGGYLSKTELGLRGPFVHVLTKKGRQIADVGKFPEEEQKLFYREDPYAVFVAHQFNSEDQELVKYLREELLEQNGFKVTEGRAEGLEEFRHAILSKIRKARFFLCLLTPRAALQSGMFVSSVWLYQEIGAAMAFGKRPLLLIEEGIEPHFQGEIQRVYEHIPFTRSNYPRVFRSIIPRLVIDLESHLIPLPSRLKEQSG